MFTKLKIEKESYINKTFRLNEKVIREMEKICDNKGVSLNKLVDIFIRFSLENLDKSEAGE